MCVSQTSNVNWRISRWFPFINILVDGCSHVLIASFVLGVLFRTSEVLQLELNERKCPFVRLIHNLVPVTVPKMYERRGTRQTEFGDTHFSERLGPPLHFWSRWECLVDSLWWLFFVFRWLRLWMPYCLDYCLSCEWFGSVLELELIWYDWRCSVCVCLLWLWQWVR